MTRAIAEYRGPVYMRITRNDMPDLPGTDVPFAIGRPGLVRDGSDVVIYAMGQEVSEAVWAAEALELEGIYARVVNISTVKPADERAIMDLAQGMRGIVTAEEHSVIGGLAGLITWIFRGQGIPMNCVGVQDRFGQSASSYAELQQEYGLTANHIAEAVRKLVL